MQMRQYMTFKESMLPAADIPALLKKFSLTGLEVYMDDIDPRDNKLLGDEKKTAALLEKLRGLHVKRLHCSYWANPTSFLTKNNFPELIEHFGGVKAVGDYYGDLTGKHYIERLADEYELCCLLGADAYTFHLIDYAPIDGMWEFTISRADIMQAMIFLLEQFMAELHTRGLLAADSPLIELENAGWGLEYGAQTADDFAAIFDQLWDPFKRVRVSFDFNHLLHATGYDNSACRARFFLPDDEVSARMRRIEESFGCDGGDFCLEWIKSNLLDERLRGRVGSVQLADCALKTTEYFVRGQLTDKYFKDIRALDTWEQREDYGVRIVLGEYDSHPPLGEGALKPGAVRELLKSAAAANPGMCIVHELKNSTDILRDMSVQCAEL